MNVERVTREQAEAMAAEDVPEGTVTVRVRVSPRFLVEMMGRLRLDHVYIERDDRDELDLERG